MYPHLSDATAPYQLRPFFRKDRKQKVLAVMVPLDQLEGSRTAATDPEHSRPCLE